MTYKSKSILLIPYLYLGMLGMLLLFSCGQEKKETEETKKDPAASQVVVKSAQTTQNNNTKIPIQIQKAQGQTTGFSLTTTSADNYQIQMSGCISGLTGTVNETNTDGLEVYKFDRNCLAKLTSFTVGGKTYYPTSGDPFTTWQVGDMAVFDESGEPGTAPLNVVVTATLNNPISGSEQIKYAFADIIEGQDKAILWSTFGSTGKIMVNSSVEPSFSIRSLQLVGQTANEGGKFIIVLECNSDIGITNVCETVDLSDIDYVLVEDTYSDTPTEAEAAAAFSGAEQVVTLPADRVAPGDQSTTNGGFVTITLDGPDDMALTPSMMLILRSYTESFQYLNVDVVVSTNY